MEADWAFSGLAAYNSSWLVPPPRPVYVPFDKQVPEETGEDVASWVHARSRGIGGHVVPRVPVVREHPRLPSIAIRQHHLVERAHPSSVTTTTTTTTTAAAAAVRSGHNDNQKVQFACSVSGSAVLTKLTSLEKKSQEPVKKSIVSGEGGGRQLHSQGEEQIPFHNKSGLIKRTLVTRSC